MTDEGVFSELGTGFKKIFGQFSPVVTDIIFAIVEAFGFPIQDVMAAFLKAGEGLNANSSALMDRSVIGM